MKCDEAREFVSAMYDGEILPPQAAEHMAHCEDCQELLKEYAGIGATLRGYGSLLLAEPVLDRTWLTTRRYKTRWWEKGLQTMRIPRVAFACLVVMLVVLGSRLALVEVRAHEDGSVLLLKLKPARGESISCALSTVDANNDFCGGVSKIDGSNLLFSLKALRKESGRVLLSVRSRVTPLGPANFNPDIDASLPEVQLWFTPGDSLLLAGTGELKVTLTGDWGDHVPVMFSGNQMLDPAPGEIRLASPLLLKDNQIAGDMEGATAVADRPGESLSLYIPGEGRFLLSSMPMAGAMQAKVQLNRVSFKSNGNAFVIVTGMPVTRGESIWVRHDADYKLPPGSEPTASLGLNPAGKLL